MAFTMRTALRLVPALCALGFLESPSLCADVVVEQSVVWASNNHLYELLANQGNTGISWTDAENFAVLHGGYLATVDSAATQAWIWSQFGSASYHYWIGLEHSGGQYIWVGTGQAYTYSYWYPGEPNNYQGIEPYALVLTYGFPGGNGTAWTGQWNDYQNTTDFMGTPIYAVADMGTVPEPASLGMLAIGAALLAGLRRRA